MKLISAFVICVSLALAPAFAGTASDPCRVLLEGIQAKFNTTEISEHYDAFAAFDESNPTVKSIGVRPGKHGGSLITLERIGESWTSDFRTVDFDPQGDPRWFIETVGVEAAKFFGFEWVDSKTLVVPNQIEFEGALSKIDKELMAKGFEPITVHFYETPHSKNTSVGEYVNRYKTEHRIPMAPSGNHLYHDLSFHTGAIFIPKKFVKYFKKHLEYEDSFFEFLKNKYKDDQLKVKAIKHYQYISNFIHTVDIDVATATVSLSIIQYAHDLKKGQARNLDFYFSVLPGLTGAIGSPYSSLRRTFNLIDQKIVMYGITLEKTLPLLEVFSMRLMKSELKSFTENYGVRDGFNPKNAMGASRELNADLCKSISEKRTQIIDAVLDILKGQKGK